jgi:hypothetical protein
MFNICSKTLKEAIQQRALRTLKQKRMYEAQITQLSQQTFNMESAALATENLRNTMATVDAMQMANKEMKKQYGKLDVDKIEVSEESTSRLGIFAQFSFCSLFWMEDRVFITIWKIY